MSEPSTQPTETPKLEDPKFGFNDYAERLNGRAAMVGFLLVLAIEYFTGQGLLSWLVLQWYLDGGDWRHRRLSILQPVTPSISKSQLILEVFDKH